MNTDQSSHKNPSRINYSDLAIILLLIGLPLIELHLSFFRSHRSNNFDKTRDHGTHAELYGTEEPKVQRNLSETKRHKPLLFVNGSLPNILFYKTHKTGSSSIQNIMYRLGLYQKMPIIFGWRQTTTIGYPKFFEVQMVMNKLHSAKISTNHLRPSKELYQVFTTGEDNLFQFTILREPYSLLKSSFHYYRGYARCFNIAKNFTDLMENYPEIALEDWQSNPSNISCPYCHNLLSHDLGYEKNLFAVVGENAFNEIASDTDTDKKIKIQKDTRINEIIADIDKKLNLCLILEHYWESIILLKEALNLSFNQIIAFKLNRAIPNEGEAMIKEYGFDAKNDNKLNDYYKNELIPKYLPIDTAIYNYFYQKFINKWKEYGEEKMANNVKILKEMTKNMYEKTCNVTEVLPLGKAPGVFRDDQNVPRNKKPWHPKFIKTSTLLIDIPETDENYDLCLHMTMPENSMGPFVKKKQREDKVIEVKTGRKRRHAVNDQCPIYLDGVRLNLYT